VSYLAGGEGRRSRACASAVEESFGLVQPALLNEIQRNLIVSYSAVCGIRVRLHPIPSTALALTSFTPIPILPWRRRSQVSTEEPPKSLPSQVGYEKKEPVAWKEINIHAEQFRLATLVGDFRLL
jgi:hypothetical protein